MVKLENSDGFVANSALFLAITGVVVAVGAVLLLLWSAVAAGIVDTAVLGSAVGITEKTAWYFSRSSGMVAYLLLAGSTIWGLLLSTKLIKDHVPAALSLGMHNVLSWLAIFLTSLHALVLLVDGYYTYTATNLLVPFTGPYKPGWVGLGIISFYLMVLTSLSFYMRKRIGQKMWRRLHYLTFATYLLATIHGVQAGTDSGNLGMQLIYWGSGLLVLFLINYRIITGMAAGTTQRSSQRNTIRR